MNCRPNPFVLDCIIPVSFHHSSTWEIGTVIHANEGGPGHESESSGVFSDLDNGDARLNAGVTWRTLVGINSRI